MAWFSSLTNLLSVENPNKVLAVCSQDYSLNSIHNRDDSLVLYAVSKVDNKFTLVLHRPLSDSMTEAYSICRSDLKTAEENFYIYKNKLPIIVSIRKDLYNVNSIQKICDLLRSHTTWNVAHLATALGLSDVLSNPDIMQFVNIEEAEKGLSPLQLAINDQNIKMVQSLLNCNASPDYFDYSQNSVLHHAASTNKQIINLICEKSKLTLNSRNSLGRTPLHVACAADKRDCVHALLEAGADVNISAIERQNSIPTPGLVGPMQDFPKNIHADDIKYGGTPIHWASSAEVIEALVNKNCDINSLNFDQRTALHLMVLRDRLDCLVTLLSFRADCNIADKDGNTPLHLAVINKNETILKALLVFGADKSRLNKKGHLPIHAIPSDDIGNKLLYILHSVGAPRCSKTQKSCNLGCKYDESFIGVSPSTQHHSNDRELLDNLLSVNEIPNKKGKMGRLLCLDGGGIRGLILIVILMELEKYFHRPIYECFDWIAGTSTGGILSLALVSKIPLFDCLCLYFKIKNVVFCGKRPYCSEVFEEILKKTYGEKVKMKDIKHPKVMITSTLVDRLPVDLHIFRNYPSPSTILNIRHSSPFEELSSPSEHFLWEAARASGAAPSYFRTFGRFLDGGLISNNPTLDALTEIQEYNTALIHTGREEEVVNLSLVVSIGTGVCPVKALNEPVDLFWPGSLWDTSKLFLSMSKMGTILTDQATQADGRVVDRARSWCSSMKIPYFRFSPHISQEVPLDERNNEVLINMLWETKAYMFSKFGRIFTLCDILSTLG